MKKRIYTTNYDLIQLKDTLSNMIEYRCEDTLSEHLKQQFINSRMYHGYLKNNEFLLWWYSWGRTGVLYPVFKGKIISGDEKFQVEIQYGMNTLGKTVLLIMNIWLIYFFISEIIGDEVSPTLFGSSGLFLIYALIVIESALVYLSYAYKSDGLDAIEKRLQLRPINP